MDEVQQSGISLAPEHSSIAAWGGLSSIHTTQWYVVMQRFWTAEKLIMIVCYLLQEPPDEGLMCECLWSDPAPEGGRQASKRGVGLQFGPDITKDFLNNNGLELVVRSHEVRAWVQ